MEQNPGYLNSLCSTAFAMARKFKVWLQDANLGFTEVTPSASAPLPLSVNRCFMFHRELLEMQ